VSAERATSAAGSADTALTAEQILVAAEEVLRRFGPAKATVVDVARALRVSHGSVYRHFPSKAALREAVAERWLDRTHAALPAVAESDDPAPERLRRWLAALFATKRAKALDDPELFATYTVLVSEDREVIARHVAGLVAQLGRIIADGVAQGAFAVADVGDAARAVFDATARFHDPMYAGQWADPAVEAAFDRVCALILKGLLTRPE
jgi:AcrR family transcriptional regulator